jgi:hypothetical protein
MRVTWALLCVLAASRGQLRKLVLRDAPTDIASAPPLDEPHPEFKVLRDALAHTEEAIHEAEAAALGHSDSNRLLQNVIVVAMRQVRALSAETHTLTPQLQACLIVHRPQVFLNASGMEPSARALAADPTGNSSAHAIRSEMHSLRVLDGEVAALKKAIDGCATCQGMTLSLAALLPAAAPLVPTIIDELNEVTTRFTVLTNAARAGKSSGDVMAGMSAEAIKASFRLQDEVDELRDRLIKCGNEAAPFEFHEEVEVHLGDYPEVAQTMITRARDETDERAREIPPLKAELEQCKANCAALAR